MLVDNALGLPDSRVLSLPKWTWDAKYGIYFGK